MKLYCPACYEVNDWGRETCVRCGAPLRGPEGETYAQKLIWALRHREPSTALRAATILGDLRATEAVDALTEVLRGPGFDPYVAAAAARSLGEIGDGRCRSALTRVLREEGPVQVRLAAVEALEALGPDEDAARALRAASARDRSERVRESAGKVLSAWRQRA
ncbi:MAG: HEAT repeat domain-containing protein [Actinomycetota bacterium]